VIGNRTKVKVVKNKVAPPFTEAEFDILYAEGISYAGSIVDAAIQYGLIEKRGSWLSFEGEHLGQGRDAVRDMLRTDKEMADKLVDQGEGKGPRSPSGRRAPPAADEAE
jgi:recombination protein RecA